tara:strand:+ start:60 stop:491 length:432 start_codon:yes stop_codon:yes gene_type:complete
MKKTFKGQIAHNATNTVRLSTNDGLTGYKIHKFQMMDSAPAANSNEFILKVFTVKPTSVNGTVNFDDPTLIASGFMAGNTDTRFDVRQTVIFDNIVFNQDIYITCFDEQGNNGTCNFYLELEQVKLDLSEATVATLKDMRGRE